MVISVQHCQTRRLLIQLHSSTICLCISSLLRNLSVGCRSCHTRVDISLSLPSIVHEKRFSLIKKKCRCPHYGMLLYVWHTFHLRAACTGLLASVSFTGHTFRCKSPSTFLNKTGIRLQNCQPEWRIFQLQHRALCVCTQPQKARNKHYDMILSTKQFCICLKLGDSSLRPL